MAQESECYNSDLSDKVHPLPRFTLGIVGSAISMNLLQQPSHVVNQRAHGLHTLGILRHFAWSHAVGAVPVLRGYDGHVHHLEHQVQRLVGCRSTATTADGNCCRRLILNLGTREECSLKHSHHRSVGLTIIDGRADDERIGLIEFLYNSVSDVVIKDTAAELFHLALSAGNAAADGLVAQLHDFRLYTILLQLTGNLCECRERVAIPVGTSV